MSINDARILLAEDDDALRVLLATILRIDGYEVVAVRDGKHLLSRILEALNDSGGLDGVDLILTDIHMPKYDALMILRGLRAADIDVPVVMMSAFCDSYTVEQAVQLGAMGVLDKPFDTDRLRQVLSDVLARHDLGEGSGAN
jgi:CheY-like chemotaxis protein